MGQEGETLSTPEKFALDISKYRQFKPARKRLRSLAKHVNRLSPVVAMDTTSPKDKGVPAPLSRVPATRVMETVIPKQESAAPISTNFGEIQPLTLSLQRTVTPASPPTDQALSIPSPPRSDRQIRLLTRQEAIWNSLPNFRRVAAAFFFATLWAIYSQTQLIQP